jgi:hypothetical protein
MAKAKAKVIKKASPSKVPAGYRVIGRAASWDMDKHPVLEGERGKTKEVTFTDKETGEERTINTMIVQDEELGAVVVWESGMLRDFFDQTDEGDVVRIEYLGIDKKKPKKGHNPAKLFHCLVKD